MLQRDAYRTLFLIIELVVVIITLGVFAHGRTSGLRTALWTTGGEQGWNSDPRLRIYFYANHREPPKVPVLWTEGLTDSLLGIAILNAALWMIRLVLFCWDIGPLWVGAAYDLILSGLWTYGVNSQSSSDLTDCQHLSIRPWYLEQDCAQLEGQVGVVCGNGKASFSVAVVCMIFYFARSIGSVLRLAYSCGEYDVLGRCVDYIDKKLLGSEEKQARRWVVGDGRLVERGAAPHVEGCICCP